MRPSAAAKSAASTAQRRCPKVLIFHAGTEADAKGHIRAVGGRVLNVCATGADLRAARDAAYAAIRAIDWPEGFSRADIGWRAFGAG